MYKVLVASRNEADNALIQKKLNPIAKQVGDLQFISTRPAALPGLIETNFNLVVFNCQHFNSATRNNVTHWRSLGYLGPVVVLVKVPDPKVLETFADLKNVTLIEKPYDNKDLQGIAVKYLTDTAVNQRKFRRFDTNQKALLESYNKDFSSYSLISNISKGGAQINGDLNDISKGDLLRVCFELDEIKKSHTMSAQVVWTSGAEGQNDRSAGLMFIPKSKVYESLLNGV